jgi:hypothetical protein
MRCHQRKGGSVSFRHFASSHDALARIRGNHSLWETSEVGDKSEDVIVVADASLEPTSTQHLLPEVPKGPLAPVAATAVASEGFGSQSIGFSDTDLEP